MSNPRIEEVEDDEFMDDPEEMDLDAFDFAQPQGKSLGISPASNETSQMPPEFMQTLLQGRQPQHGSSGSSSVPQMPSMSERERERYSREQQEKSKRYQCIYPVYFDSTRSRQEGRRVPKQYAVPNPLAREIVEALSVIGNTLQTSLQIVLEPTKTHPQDWANPGRVKVLIKKEGTAVSSKIHNKQYLFRLIAEWLQAHPTTADTPKKMQIQGLPMPKDQMPTPAVPRGFKMSRILPLHSPALSGGGVSENMFKDMMAEMGGQLPGMMSDSSDQLQKKGKDKKKK